MAKSGWKNVVSEPQKEPRPKGVSASGWEIVKLLQEMQDETRLQKWNEFADEIRIFDNAMAAALMANRPELARLSPYAQGKQAVTPEQTKMLYETIFTLVETNRLLQQHAEQVACIVDNWMGNFKGLLKAAHEIQNFANFRQVLEMDEDDE